MRLSAVLEELRSSGHLLGITPETSEAELVALFGEPLARRGRSAVLKTLCFVHADLSVDVSLVPPGEVALVHVEGLEAGPAVALDAWHAEVTSPTTTRLQAGNIRVVLERTHGDRCALSWQL